MNGYSYTESMDTTILPRSFYSRDTTTVARDLLGKIIVRELPEGLVAGIIVETESYGYQDDPASHTFRGLSKRNTAMFGPVGHAYIYFIYGNHYCFDVVARPEHIEAGGVLVRAVQPVLGIEIMQKRRGGVKIKDLTNGPGKLAQAMGITMKDNHHNLMQKGALYLAQGIEVPESAILATPRIGISKAMDKLWRFCIRGNAVTSNMKSRSEQFKS